MEPLTKKPSTPMSFAAAAGKAPAAAPVSSASQGGPSGGGAKNGSNPSTNQPSPASGSQTPAASPAGRAGVDKASASGSPTSDGLDWIVGLNVKVVTVADEVFEGQVYAYDTVLNCLALQCPLVKPATASSSTNASHNSPSLGSSNTNGPRPKYDFRILKINYIKEVTPLPSTGATDADTKTKSTNSAAPVSSDKDPKDNTRNVYATAIPTVGYVQMEKIQQREQQVVKEAQVAAARIGVGVSTIGQTIFDALSKTLPCRWAGESIVVMDEVIISSPYEPDNCKANSSASNTLARVKKVLDGERKRLANGRR
ncbi:anticodon-binding domain-containing protein [Mortierella sp. GBAus27b]|nr:anticodon-binding domain-containing protein [Mortierella sp. GBAus27b]